jgi:molybdenum cofactor synthesis domain-containing protein
MAAEITAAILTVSDSAARGEREDASGPALAERLGSLFGISSPVRHVVADETREVAGQISSWSEAGVSLILVTGGTGVSPRDRTPEAVRSILDVEIPGFAEKMRAETGRNFPAAYLSRQVAGVRGRSLILALPGSPRGAVECLDSVASLIPHALALIRGNPGFHPHR